MSFVSTDHRHRRARAAARCHHPRRDPPAVLAHRHAARHRQRGKRCLVCRRDGGARHCRICRRGQCPALRGAGGVLRPRARPEPQILLAASTRSRPRPCRRPRKRRCARPSSMPISPTGNRSSNSAAAGVRCRCGWRGSFRIRRSRRFRTRTRSANIIEGEAARRGLTNLRVITSGHERVRARRAVRPHRLRRDVRAHDELARTDDARARVAEARWPLLPAHLHPSLRRLSVRSRRWRGLDRAAFLHRRRDAEPSSDPAICRSVRGRKGMALERRALSAHRAGLARQFRSRIATRSSACCARSMAARPRCGCGAGAGSSSPPQACSVTPMAASGASAITG